MGLASLGSGSKGNGTVVAMRSEAEAATPDVLFLVDCGFSLKQTEKRLARLGLSGGDLDAIFVSHEHSDHMSGVAALAHKFAIPVYASFGTARRLDVKCHTFDGDQRFTVRGVSVNPVRVPHDAREPTQFVFEDAVDKVGVLSDLGKITQHVIDQYAACSHLLMEANHDLNMLRNGRYTPALKRRVAADYGHLNNEQAYALLHEIAHPELAVVIGHVSEQNNCPNILANLFAPMRDRVAELQIATQSDGIGWLGAQPLVRQSTFSEVL